MLLEGESVWRRKGREGEGSGGGGDDKCEILSRGSSG